MNGARQLSDAFDRSTPDAELVRQCRNGSEDAWAGLLDKYKNLIYSIPTKLGFDRSDSNEVFQDVCATLLVELHQLREPQALAAWLITTARRSCYRLHRSANKTGPLEGAVPDMPADAEEIPERILRRLEEEQIVRDIVNGLEPQCRDLVRLLFFSDPPVPYEEAAAQLGLATGSIGAIRMRCLVRLRRQLELRGLP